MAADNSVRKYCLVPCCPNTSTNAKEKLFFSVPKDNKKRKAWIKAMRKDDRNELKLSSNSSLYCCEDHFSVSNSLFLQIPKKN